MLRFFVLLLFLLNLGYFAWSHGALSTLGLAPAETSEPQHQLQQIRPETLQILRTAPASDAAPASAPFSASSSASSSTSAASSAVPAASAPPTDAAVAPASAPATAAEAASVAAAAPHPTGPAAASRPSAAPTVCLQAGTFDAHQAETLRKALARWPQGSWTLAGEDGGRIFQPPTAAVIVDGVYPSLAALAGAREVTLSADNALPGPPSAVIAMAPTGPPAT